MNTDIQQKLIAVINDAIEPMSATPNYESLLEKIGDARFVMIGEASHGTHEFYQTRIELTQELIMKKGFMAVAIEGDWPDAHRIHRYIQGRNNTDDSMTALDDFKRFPMWMWRNTTMPPFLQWLRQYNDNTVAKVGFYGLDLYSMSASIKAVIDYLMTIDKTAAALAKNSYACFDHLNIDPQMYGYLTRIGTKKTCIDETMQALREIQHKAFKYLQDDGPAAEDDCFFAIQNARVVKDAEVYYRSMFESHVSSWNIRDTHMFETLNIVADHLEHQYKKPAKIVIWAHNSHVGDARATEMGERGEVNMGQLMREQHEDTYTIGFSTYDGQVTAASNWDEPAVLKNIVPGIKGSYEALFHEAHTKNFILNLVGHDELAHFLKIPRLQRAIGVIYRPETERQSHYFFTHLPYQFDSLIHFDKTTALKSLD